MESGKKKPGLEDLEKILIMDKDEFHQWTLDQIEEGLRDGDLTQKQADNLREESTKSNKDTPTKSN